MKKLTSVFILVVVLLAMGGQSQAAGDVDSAKFAALQWLSLADNGEYGAAWDQTAQFFKQQVPRAAFIASLQQVRTPLRGIASRTLRSATATTSVPNAPPGRYVVIVYDTSFASQAGMSEVITPMLDADGKWRVSGYYIRPGTH